MVHKFPFVDHFRTLTTQINPTRLTVLSSLHDEFASFAFLYIFDSTSMILYSILFVSFSPKESKNLFVELPIAQTKVLIGVAVLTGKLVATCVIENIAFELTLWTGEWSICAGWTVDGAVFLL